MIALYFCRACGRRDWTNTSEPAPTHDCTDGEPVLSRMPMEPPRWTHSTPEEIPMPKERAA